MVMKKCDAVNRCGPVITVPFPTLRQSAALYAYLTALVTVDSFPAHLAAVTGTPAVVLYGPSNPVCWKHPGQIAMRPTQCQVCADSQRIRECHTHDCMKEFALDAVIDSVLAILSRTNTAGKTYA
jgi:ADP-heptose:LPS heptosyltransferase